MLHQQHKICRTGSVASRVLPGTDYTVKLLGRVFRLVTVRLATTVDTARNLALCMLCTAYFV